MATARHEFTTTRALRERQDTSAGGMRMVTVGEETLDCTITIDLDKLARQLSAKLRFNGKNKTTIGDGSIVMVARPRQTTTA